MYSDIDSGLVYLLLHTANRPLIRTKLNEFVKVYPIGFGLSKKLTLAKLIHFLRARPIFTHYPKSLLSIFDDH